ncbi:MAG: hypothetical protein ACHQ03_10510 [Candidatus Bathyarchaeia archaeon]
MAFPIFNRPSLLHVYVALVFVIAAILLVFQSPFILDVSRPIAEIIVRVVPLSLADVTFYVAAIGTLLLSSFLALTALLTIFVVWYQAIESAAKLLHLLKRIKRKRPKAD